MHLAWVRWWSALAYHAFSLAEGVRRHGFASRIVAPPSSPLADRAASAGMDGSRWRDLASRRPDRWLRAFRDLREAAVSGRLAAVFVHTGSGHFAAAAALRATRSPLLRFRADIRRPAAGPAARWLYVEGSDRVLPSGRFMIPGYFERLAVPAERIEVLPAGIDPETGGTIDRECARRRLREERGWPEGAVVAGMLARYSPVKGHADLVAAARSLLDPARGALAERLRFVCAGPEGQLGREAVETMAREAGIADRFAVLPAVDDPLALAAGLDAAVIASTGSEAVCRSALEYMALGVPLVATEVHVIPETVGDAGVLVPPAHPGALAGAIASLLDEPARARSLAERGRRRVRERFDIARTSRRALEIVEAAAEERERRRSHGPRGARR